MNMKQIFSILLFMMFISLNGTAQQIKNNADINIVGFSAKISDNKLLINWSSKEKNENDYWLVQGSRDGKEFSTIGLVLGAEPSVEARTYIFKQVLTKIKHSLKYYRVLHIETPEIAVVSEIIELTK